MVQNVKVGNDLFVGNFIRSPRADFSEILTSLRVNATEQVDTKTALIRDALDVKGESNLGSLVVKPHHVHIVGNMTADETVHIRNTLLVDGLLSVEILNVAQEMSASSIRVLDQGGIQVEQGLVISAVGFKTESGVVECKKMNVTEVSTAKVGVFELISADSFAAESINSNHAKINRTQMMDANITNLSVAGFVDIGCNMTVHGDVHSNQKVMASEIHAVSGVKSRSVFATRVYTEDLAASGFVTADSIINKGDMKVHGKAEIDSVTVQSKVTSAYLNVTQSMVCTTATVHGVIDAAGIVSRKLTLNGELIVKGQDVMAKMDEIEELKRRIDVLEEILNKLLPAPSVA